VRAALIAGGSASAGPGIAPDTLRKTAFEANRVRDELTAARIALGPRVKRGDDGLLESRHQHRRHPRESGDPGAPYTLLKTEFKAKRMRDEHDRG